MISGKLSDVAFEISIYVHFCFSRCSEGGEITVLSLSLSPHPLLSLFARTPFSLHRKTPSRKCLRSCRLEFYVFFPVIYQINGRVFHQIPKHCEVDWNNEAQPSFFNQLRSVWISDETLFQLFDIASQRIYNSWRKSKQNFYQFYDN